MAETCLTTNRMEKTVLCIQYFTIRKLALTEALPYRPERKSVSFVAGRFRPLCLVRWHSEKVQASFQIILKQKRLPDAFFKFWITFPPLTATPKMD